MTLLRRPIRRELDQIKAGLAHDTYNTVRTLLPQVIQDPSRAQILLDEVNTAERGKREAKNSVASIAKKFGYVTMGGIASLTLAGILGAAHFVRGSEPEPVQTPQSVVVHQPARAYDIEYRVAGTWYNQDSKPAGDVEDARVTALGTTLYVDPDAVTSLRKLISTAEFNDGNIPGNPATYSPIEVAALIRTLPRKTYAGEENRASHKDIQMGIGVVGDTGGLKELGGKK